MCSEGRKEGRKMGRTGGRWIGEEGGKEQRDGGRRGVIQFCFDKRVLVVLKGSKEEKGVGVRER